MNFRHVARGLLLAACVPCQLCGHAFGQVTRLVPAHHPTIQGAIAAANPGDTILVAMGTWTGTIDFLGKAIRIRSVAGPAVTTIVGPGATDAAVVRFISGESSSALLDGFTITQGGIGVLCTNGATPSIRRCIVTGNTHLANGPGRGGGVSVTSASPSFHECRIVNNTVFSSAWESMGGGVYAHLGTPHFENCVIADNQATSMTDSFAGGISGTVSLVACTVANNHAMSAPDNVLTIIGTTTATHSIFWMDSGQSGLCTSYLPCPHSALSIDWSLVGGGWSGIGNLDADPRFRNAAAGDYHLAADSPCVNAGDLAATDLPLTDLDGDPRILYLTPDLGADERLPPRTLDLALGQPFGPGSLGVQITGGAPDAPYLTLFSFDLANAGSGLGTGTWGGLHLATSEVMLQFLTRAPPFVGSLDSNGATTFTLPAGTLQNFSGFTLYALTHVAEVTTGRLLATSPVALLPLS